jgi:hypothetical protein
MRTVGCDRCYKQVQVEDSSELQDRLQDVVDGLAEEFICETCIAETDQTKETTMIEMIITDEIKHTFVSRVLTHTEIQLFSYLGSERSAIAMAPFAHLSENASYTEIEYEVTRILADMLVKKNGNEEVEYVCRERRDTLRQ